MSSTTITVDDLTFRYPGSDEPVLRNVNVEIDSGEFTAIIGGNGSGKTTLCKAFNGLIPHFFNGTFQGTVSIGDTVTTESDVSGLSKTVGYVFQDFENQLVQPIVLDDVAFAPKNHGLEDYETRAMRALESVGLEDAADRFIWELSGGQQHLVALAGVLAMEPQFIIVDEPAAQLDPHNARKTYEQLREIQRETEVGVIAIEHHTEFIGDYCDRLVMVADGDVAWANRVDVGLNRVEELLDADIHPPQVTQIARQLPNKQGTLPSGRYPVTVEQAVSAFPTGSPKGDPPVKPDGRGSDETLITVSNLTHGYPTLREGRKTVLDAFDLELYADSRVALVGANGAGKSTLLRLLTGLESPDKGTVTVLGNDTNDTLPEELAEETVYIHQNPEEMFVEETVREDIAYYLESRDDPDVDERVADVIEFLDLEDIADRDGRLLSVGQQRRASLAIGLATDPTIVLLDEPTGSLDLQSRREVTRILSRSVTRTETVVVATHDLQLVAEWADRVIVLGPNGILADETPQSVFQQPGLLEQAHLRPPQVVELSDRLGIDPPSLTKSDIVDRLATQGGR
ncbi:ATP-binding cassette domain-containing protein [Natronomonas sp. F2-12]|uniref:ATP-binding cassette domain-containing protein n=1 Tax=Natronomonas aquatica TaxID=2841590 RepID=A0A9R1CUL4_9EURY|nr:energy-coupling factor transporter ATPase [Natronomonas aquatica]MCQ4334247.1 ATP-binding cassette domain-containing protein [Natronomonas aquatica]